MNSNEDVDARDKPAHDEPNEERQAYRCALAMTAAEV